MSQRSSNSIRHSLIGGYIGEREGTGVGVHERTYLKNGETYHVNNMRHSIRGRICADMRDRLRFSFSCVWHNEGC
jgi:hypothetical protein